MTYRNCKKLIEAGLLKGETLACMLDVFLKNSRITPQEHQLLTDLAKGGEGV